MPKRYWNHRTRVYCHERVWMWECLRCPMMKGSIFWTQPEAYKSAEYHTFLCGYHL